MERQNYYNEKVSKKREDLNNEINSKCELICSFSPKITNEKGEYYRIKKNKELNKNLNKPVFKRLYEDMNKRRNYFKKKDIDVNPYNKCSSNDILGNSFLKHNPILNPSPTFGYKYFEKEKSQKDLIGNKLQNAGINLIKGN